MTVVLVHSPLVGSFTWRAVAAELARLGHQVAVPTATTFSVHFAFAHLIAQQCPAGPLTLIGHSRAGPYLPTIASLLPGRVDALVFVDSRLPHPGDPPLAHLPDETVARLRGLVRQGMLPPWPEWFPPGELATILPDPQIRASFVAELRPIPFTIYTEPMPDLEWQGPASYLLLSEAYRPDAEAAARSGVTVAELIDHHLAPLTAPAAVATALHRLLS